MEGINEIKKKGKKKSGLMITLSHLSSVLLRIANDDH
jgi:hypothetical protein